MELKTVAVATKAHGLQDSHAQYNEKHLQ